MIVRRRETPVPIAELAGLWIGTGASILLRALAETKELGAEVIPGAGKIHRAIATKWAEHLAYYYPRTPYEKLTKKEKLESWSIFQRLFEAARNTNRSIDAYMLVKHILESKQEAIAETVRRFDADRELANERLLRPEQMAMWSILPDWIIMGLLNDQPGEDVTFRIVEGKIAPYLQYFYPEDPVFHNPNQELARIVLDVDRLISASRVLKRELESEPKPNEEKRHFTPISPSDPTAEEAEEWAVAHLGDTIFIHTLLRNKGSNTLHEYGRYENVALWILEEVGKLTGLNEERLVNLWRNLTKSYPNVAGFSDYPLTPEKMFKTFPPDKLIDTTYMRPVDVYVAFLETVSDKCPSTTPIIVPYLDGFFRGQAR